MNFPQFGADQYIDQDSMNAAFAAVSGSMQLPIKSFRYPGLVGASSASFTISGLFVNSSLPAPFGVAFATGVLAQAHGTTNGADTQSYSTSFSSLVPASGAAVTAYLVASYQQIQQTPVAVVGPPQGHPDYNPNFVPYTLYQNLVDSLALSATTGVPDNATSFELCRFTLTSGMALLPAATTSFQQWALPVRASSARANGGFCTIYENPGNPNGVLPGTAASATTAPDLCWDTTEIMFWVCTTTGPAASAVWTPLAPPVVTTPTNIYINAAGGSDSNNGLSPATAFLTLQKGQNYAAGLSIRGPSGSVIVNAVGNFTSGVVINAGPIGAAGPSSYTWNFSSGSSITAGASSCFYVDNGAAVTLDGPVTLVSNGSGINGCGIVAGNGARVVMSAGTITFGHCTQAHIAAFSFGQVLDAALGYNITGGATYHWWSFSAGQISVTNATVTITSGVGFTAFANAVTQGGIACFGNTFPGASGIGGGTQRYNVDGLGYINTQLAGAAYLPGIVAGASGNGGVYA